MVMKGAKSLMKYPNEKSRKMVMKGAKSLMKNPNEKSRKW